MLVTIPLLPLPHPADPVGEHAYLHGLFCPRQQWSAQRAQKHEHDSCAYLTRHQPSLTVVVKCQASGVHWSDQHDGLLPAAVNKKPLP